MEHLLQGKDAFVIMPTGAGKSLCYQLPALVVPGLALVISPLIALMKNQVDQLQSFGVEAGYLNSSMSRGDYETVKRRTLEGEIKLLYVAPETLVRDEFLDFLAKANLAFVAVDEAHCISEWGHDFRPEYRRIRPILNRLPPVPVIALTATATPKVQQDILQNLHIEEAALFKTSFNRGNLYYEIRPKHNPVQEMVRFIKQHAGKSGIVYCLSRKKVEELAEVLTVNGVKAVPYHAGLDAETRSRHQDMFLQEDVQVVVATIAFGMGIDKPDVRYVVHFDVPKSLESYYQETGRAGRDGLEGHCVVFYDYADIVKLEKFMKDKPVSEREAGKHLLFEMAAFAESGSCRRRQLLHYFGERYETENCGMCDNCRHPKPTFDAQEEARLTLEAAIATSGRVGMAHLIQILRGQGTEQLKLVAHDQLPQFGKGAHWDDTAWKSIMVQLLVHELMSKDITDYGNLRVTSIGEAWLQHPAQLMLVKPVPPVKPGAPAEGADGAEDVKPYDELLLHKLLRLRKELADKAKLPPYVIMLENSLQEMATKYPIAISELEHITGVGKGKAAKYGAPFIELIARYVEEHEIDRPLDYVVKTQGKNSAEKLYIIQHIDRKTPLEEIAEQKDIAYGDLLQRIEQIIYAGARLNLSPYVEQMVDPDKVDAIEDYFRAAPTDDLDAAIRELGTSYDYDEVRLVRAHFYAQVAN